MYAALDESPLEFLIEILQFSNIINIITTRVESVIFLAKICQVADVTSQTEFGSDGLILLEMTNILRI